MHQSQLIILSIPFLCGIVPGVAIGLAVAGMFMQRKLAEREKSTWAQAMRFYAIREREAAERTG